MLDTVITTNDATPAATTRAPTRWSLSGTRGAGPSDGAWWPQSTDLATELADLDVAVHANLHERIARAAYTKGMWPPAPRKLHSSLGIIKVGCFTHARYPENIHLSLTNHTHLVLTVIPPGTDSGFAKIVLADYGAVPVDADRGTVRGLDAWDNEGGHPPADSSAAYGRLFE